jgi:hypothetical protein
MEVAALNEEITPMVDQVLRGIWAVDMQHGGANHLFTDEGMMDPTSQDNGVNGIRVRGSTLYFNNPRRGTFCRIPINPISGHREGNVKIITAGLEPDDFEIYESRGFCIPHQY